ncbi:MAG: lysine--tRNA ligase, partial [Patescibacteria group bacterium]|nr:lysine--tRNA ligase [Patescibacteria group bacterium]
MKNMLQDLNDEYKIRLAKLTKIRQDGVNPYPDRFSKEQTVAEALVMNLDSNIKTAGRLVIIREMGKICFCHILDNTGKIQIVLKDDVIGKDKLKQF